MTAVLAPADFRSLMQDDQHLLPLNMGFDGMKNVLSFQMGCDGKPLSVQVGGQSVAISSTEVIEPTDAKAVEIGKWAVAEHNKRAKTNLEFVCINGGWKGRVFSGILYWLAVDAKDKNDHEQIKNYEAAVVDKPGKNVRFLLRFQEI